MADTQCQGADRPSGGTPRVVSAVLFDMDGTLIDSEPVYVESNREFLAGYGISLGRAAVESFVGRGTLEMMRELGRMFPDNPLSALPPEERARLIDLAYEAYAPGRVRAFPGVVAFARRLREMGVPSAIASGSSPGIIRKMVASCGLAGLFDFALSSQEVARGKPAPDVFLEAASRLGVEPSGCLVLEDSVYGVQAALAAGMACVAMPDPGVEPGPGFRSADMLIEGGAAAADPEALLAAFAFAPGRVRA